VHDREEANVGDCQSRSPPNHRVTTKQCA
jgi:hypothetical protein